MGITKCQEYGRIEWEIKADGELYQADHNGWRLVSRVGISDT